VGITFLFAREERVVWWRERTDLPFPGRLRDTFETSKNRDRVLGDTIFLACSVCRPSPLRHNLE
jgi:hypothetical protein